MSLNIRSLAERLETIQRLLVRVEGCLRLLDLSECERYTSKQDVVNAALEDVERLDLQLCWLDSLPADVLATPVPTDDERRDIKRAGGAR